MFASPRDGLSAREVINLLGLAPHPEGGHYRETFRDERCDANGRASSSLIYFLLDAGEISAWHRVDAVEIWHWYAGGPLALTISTDGREAASTRLGSDLTAGQAPQCVVPAHAWQRAESLGAWTLVGCTVAPAFEFSRFELAPPDWRPSPK
jgi:uncharacterized protein